MPSRPVTRALEPVRLPGLEAGLTERVDELGGRAEVGHALGVGEVEEDLAAAFEAATKNRLKVLIDRILPLAEAVEAHRIVGARTGTGKVLLTPG